MGSLISTGIWVVVAIVVLIVLIWAGGLRRIRSDQVGIVEKWWSPEGLAQGRIIALDGEAGYQPDVLRGGIHFRTAAHVPGPRDAAGHDPAGQDRLRLRARRRAAAVPSRRSGSVVEGNTSRTSSSSWPRAGSEVHSARSSAKAPTRSTSPSSSSSPRRRRTTCPMGDAGEEATIQIDGQHLMSVGGFDPVVIKGADDKLRHRDRPRRTVAADRRHHRSRRSATRPTTRTTTTTSRIPRSSSRRAASAAASTRCSPRARTSSTGCSPPSSSSTRSIIPVGYAGVVVSYYRRQGRGHVRRGVPPRRARRAGQPRRVERAAHARQVRVQHSTPARSSWSRRPTSSSSGSPARPARTTTTRTWPRSR